MYANFLVFSPTSLQKFNMAVKAILRSWDINVVRCQTPSPFALSHGPSPPHRFAFPPSSSLGRSYPRLLPSRTGCPCWSPRRAKQWRDVAHENGYAFVLGNCLSFCYFVASKSQTSSHRSTPSRKRLRRFLSSIYFVFRFYT